MAGEDQKNATQAAIQQTINAAKRRVAIAKARDSLIAFIQLCMPDPNDPDNPDKSLYEPDPHHYMMAEAIEKQERGDLPRYAQAIPPQHGKSTIISRYGPAWKAGRNPFRHRIVGTYNADFAKEIGDHVRGIIMSNTFAAVFPNITVSRSTQSKSDLKLLVAGKPAGSLRFRGRGESTTGHPADDFTIDDPYKDKKEADSEVIRKECRDWYTSVVFSRCHVRSTIGIVHTRWNEDDLIGWLCDPDHPEHKPHVAKRWAYINIPAIVTDPGLAAALKLELKVQTDPIVVAAFGTAPMAALWAKRFPLSHLAEAYENDPTVFYALYMGQPSPDDGIYFKAEWLVGYEPHELPKDLKKYGASDHALTTKEENDATCLGVGGVDENDVLWILPDLVWERMETDGTADAMLDQMRRHKPLTWWAERDHIAKSIGPFLRKRMREERTYCYVEESPATQDHKTRARAMQGRMAMKMVRFPTFAPWWPRAKNELLKFPNAKHDDFVSFLAHLGMGLDRMASAQPRKPKETNVVRVGSVAWMKASIERDKRERKIAAATRGW